MAPALITAGAAHRAMAAFPLAGLDDILAGGAPLVLAPHADDESLGCGGLLALAADAKMRPAVLVLTDGAGSHPGSRAYPPARLAALREAEAREAVAALGVAPSRLGFLRLPDTRAPTQGPAFDDAVAAVAAALHEWSCTVLLAPWRYDPHGDHVAAHRIAAAARSASTRHLAYPVWGWMLDPSTPLEAPTGVRLDIAGVLARKRRAIAAHRSQYAGLIDDDPDGFQLAPGFLARFDGRYETFLTGPE